MRRSVNDARYLPAPVMEPGWRVDFPNGDTPKIFGEKPRYPHNKGTFLTRVSSAENAYRLFRGSRSRQRELERTDATRFESLVA